MAQILTNGIEHLKFFIQILPSYQAIVFGKKFVVGYASEKPISPFENIFPFCPHLPSADLVSSKSPGRHVRPLNPNP
jgi:hypothetical protein